MFKDIADVCHRLGQQQYIASEEIGTVVYLAHSLCKPILAEGPAGVGKTELAKVWALAAGMPLIRLQCYEGLDESKALYEWEYAKQMLYTQLLRDTLRNVLGDVNSLAEAANRNGQFSLGGCVRRVTSRFRAGSGTRPAAQASQHPSPGSQGRAAADSPR